MGESFFVGAELQAQRTSGWDSVYDGDSIADTVTTTQTSVQFGYSGNGNRFYGFVGGADVNVRGTGGTAISASVDSVFGIGAEFEINENMSLRMEAEFSKMTFDDACCGVTSDVGQRDLSAGVVFSF